MNYENKPQGYYDNIRLEMLDFLPKDAKSVLDVGCGNGAFAEIIKEQNKAEVWGIELMEAHAKEAAKKLDKVFTGKCENYIDNLPDNYFDAIYFNDVLEHLVDPFDVLNRMKHKLTKNGVVISSIPNIRSFDTFMKLVFKKDFKYEEDGILDLTHLRFFTKKSIRRTYENLGYTIVTHKGINKTKSIRPILFNILVLFTQMDMLNLQYATVAKYNR